MDTAEQTMRKVVDACADCDCCRFIMDTSCLFFPELYRLWDKEQETGKDTCSQELRHLANLCNYCALCPCPNIRETIITAKTQFIDREGLDRAIRILEDVERVGRWCGAFPQLTNLILNDKRAAGLIKKAAGIHPERKLPSFPQENFPTWARKRRRSIDTRTTGQRKVAYFAGCTGRHLFPDVPKATIDVLERNQIAVTYPDQQCCGMPSLLEGDRRLTLRFAERTITHLAEIVADGYAIVCSCPTCGFMLKKVLSQNAYYSKAYQNLAGGDEHRLRIPEYDSTDTSAGAKTGEHRGGHSRQGSAALAGKIRFRELDRSIYGKLLKDDGYFSSIDPLSRIHVSENTYDLGEYLLDLYRKGALNTQWGPVAGKMVYYPPCHQREQGIGSPYLDLLGQVPGVSVQSIQSSLYCCGIAGIMGFKRDFHDASLQMGRRLLSRIKGLAPDRLITDCLSCRLQFQQMTAYAVAHPIEILRTAYANGP